MKFFPILAILLLAAACSIHAADGTLPGNSFGVLMSDQNPDYNALGDDRHSKDKAGDAGYGDHKAHFDALEKRKTNPKAGF